MMNFYGRLGVPCGTPDSQLRIAIAAMRLEDPVTADRAESILLADSRRRAYDRLWLALTRIGQARAHGRLNNAPFGLSPEYAEFRFEDRETPSASPTSSTASRSRSPSDGAAKHSSTVTAHSSFGWQVARGLFRAWPLILLGLFFAAAQFNNKPPLQSDSQPVVGAAGSTNSTAKFSNFADYRDPPTSADRQSQTPSGLALDKYRNYKPFDLQVQPLPKTGEGIGAVKAGRDNWIEVKTSGVHHSLIRIEHLDGEFVARRFIRAGESLRIYLPIGEYVMKTATGRQWYGLKHRFGEQTSYGKPDDTFPLKNRGEYWTVELIPQKDGNLRERSITKEEFGAE